MSKYRLPLVGLSVCLVCTLTPSHAYAASPLDRFRELAHDAEVANQEMHEAKDTLKRLNTSCKQLTKRYTRAKKTLAATEDMRKDLQPTIDSLARMTLTNQDMSSVRAMFLASTPSDTLRLYQSQQAMTVATSNVVHDVDELEKNTRKAQNDIRVSLGTLNRQAQEQKKVLAQMDKKRHRLKKSIAEVTKLYRTLTPAEKEAWRKIHVPQAYRPATAYGTNPLGNAALTAAITRIGSPYVWGATGPSAFDCSGLVYWAYQQVGIMLPRASYGQAYTGVQVPVAHIQPGDIVIFFPDHSHVGLYAGRGLVLHAPTFGDVVKFSPLNSMPVAMIRRLL